MIRRARRGRGDDGIVIIIVAVMALTLLVMAGLAVDLGDARQQKRAAASAADAGALAGAELLDAKPAELTPDGCEDVYCSSAYYALASAERRPGDVHGFALGRTACDAATGQFCWRYSLGGVNAEVTYPFAVGDRDPKQLLHVRVCWDADTTFGTVIGINSINVCGSATAQNNRVGANNGGVKPVEEDCVVTDNFATEKIPGDKNSETPTIYTFKGTEYPDIGEVFDPKHGNKKPDPANVLVAWFHGFGSDIDLDRIKFEAPTNASAPTGDVEVLTRSTADRPFDVAGQQYVLQSLDANGRVQPYTPGGTFDVLIAYQLPDKTLLDEKAFAFEATLDAAPVGGVAGQCGHAHWILTKDKKGSTNGGTCGENSFWAFTPEPSRGLATPGDVVRAFYTDESPIQEADITQNPDVGIDFYLTDADGNVTRIPPAPVLHDPNPRTDGYTITDSDPDHRGKEHFNSTIQFRLPGPDDLNPLPGSFYKVFLKAYDTDNNKPGNDCGVFTWSFRFTGSNTPGGGEISLVE